MMDTLSPVPIPQDSHRPVNKNVVTSDSFFGGVVPHGGHIWLVPIPEDSHGPIFCNQRHLFLGMCYSMVGKSGLYTYLRIPMGQ